MKKLFFIALVFTISISASAQRFKMEKSKISFFSSAPLEDIDAYNTESVGLIDMEKMTFAFSVPITGFQFKKKLMQEHFNENYLESEKFPKAYFQGKIVGLTEKTGKQSVFAKGVLTIHGVSNDVTIPSTIEFNANGLKVEAKFKVKIADYNIEIPKMVLMNIAEIVDVTVKTEFKKMKENAK